MKSLFTINFRWKPILKSINLNCKCYNSTLNLTTVSNINYASKQRFSTALKLKTTELQNHANRFYEPSVKEREVGRFYSEGQREQGNHSSQEGNEPISKKIVGYWYLGCASMVFGIVILGGVTRLTESGLSIVEWNLIKGMKPPTSNSEWEAEFEKYKQFPEYQLLNHNITLNEFKRIFYYEWAHRMVGRSIGLCFVIPGLYFAAKGYMTRAIKLRSFIVACMIGTQGVFGWYMVKSGLNHEILAKKDVPRVNHFWLSIHLGSAFAIYSAMLFTGLGILRQNRILNAGLESAFMSKGLSRFKYASIGIFGLSFVTAITGAWVAGLDAGLIYNEFPLMGNGFVPSDMWAFSTQSADGTEGRMSHFENLFKNPSAVQFNHRLLAMTTLTAISALSVFARKIPTLPKSSRFAVNALMGTVLLQASLGISTLIFYVPVPLAASHQAGSLTLLSVALWLIFTLSP